MMPAQPRGTDGSLLSSLPWTLGALGVALLPHLPYLAIWITVALVACAAWRFRIEVRRTMLPSRTVRGTLAVACFLGVFATYSSISGVGPGSALLAIMAAMKLLETRKRRDQFVLLFISIFLVMSSLLREQYLWSLPYLVVSMLFILTAWLRMSAQETEAPRESFATGRRLMLYAAPLAIAMWVLFPRLSSPFWAVPIDTSQGTTGISDTMSPGDISNLSRSDAVAFRVKFDDQIPAPQDRYWRGLVLTEFNGRTWTAPEFEPGGSQRDQIDFTGAEINYEITMEATSQRYLFALEMPLQWSLKATYTSDKQELFRVKPIDQRLAYKVTSYTDFRVQADKPLWRRNVYTRIPVSGNARTANLAREMRASAGSDSAFVNAVLEKFNGEDYYYTLQPPPLGASPIDEFLFDSKRGFCEHYASAFTFMMRSAGVPARVVLGYQGGEVNPMGGHMIVRQSDAHAWTEVWLEGLGWRRVDPTAAVAPERIEFDGSDASMDGMRESWGFSASSDLLENAVLIWDALDAKWNELILGYGPENQRNFLEWLGMKDPSWRKMLLTLVGIIIAIILAISGLLMLRYREPRKDPAALLYARFVRKTGIERQRGETEQHFAQRVQEAQALPAASVTEITDAYLDARYGPKREEQLPRLKRAVAALR